MAGCATILFYPSNAPGAYSENAVVHPVPGEIVGEIRIPWCNDTGESVSPPDAVRQVASISGVDVTVAVVDAGGEVIYVAGADPDPLPPEILHYFIAPNCEQQDAPIELEGPWLSIPGTDASVEPDPVPPYGVEILVAESSSPAYLNAELTIAVPPTLGMRITHTDIEESLWRAGPSASSRGARESASSLRRSWCSRPRPPSARGPEEVRGRR
ncbi:MAG: hypothetical protein ACXWXS_11305 [Actinomycetota bacterium]